MSKEYNIKQTKGLNIMELNETQKSVVQILYDTYKSDTVTRSEINDLVKKKNRSTTIIIIRFTIKSLKLT